jgi:ferrochelatase
MIRPEPSDGLPTACETEMISDFDAILIVGFGGPEKPEDVMPFLENVTRGRNIPRERLEEVAEHYHHFGGVSPINAQVRALMDALGPELRRHGVTLPVYWGNRNWSPMLTDTMREMSGAGVKKALAVVLAAYSSYSSCRQYREDIGRARDEVGPSAPEVAKTRVFFNHPDFITANADRVREALAKVPAEDRGQVAIGFTAHSIPAAMAANSDYEEQLRETCRLIAAELNIDDHRWSLVYQSRSGRPGDLWLEPDVLDYLRDLREQGGREVIIHPVGFLSDHMEVLYDLDEEARLLCDQIGLNMVRSSTVGTHRGFVRMLCELVCERLQGAAEDEKRAIGRLGPSHDVCPLDCCPPPARPQRLAHAQS